MDIADTRVPVHIGSPGSTAAHEPKDRNDCPYGLPGKTLSQGILKILSGCFEPKHQRGSPEQLRRHAIEGNLWYDSCCYQSFVGTFSNRWILPCHV